MPSCSCLLGYFIFYIFVYKKGDSDILSTWLQAVSCVRQSKIIAGSEFAQDQHVLLPKADKVSAICNFLSHVVLISNCYISKSGEKMKDKHYFSLMVPWVFPLPFLSDEYALLPLVTWSYFLSCRRRMYRVVSHEMSSLQMLCNCFFYYSFQQKRILILRPSWMSATPSSSTLQPWSHTWSNPSRGCWSIPSCWRSSTRSQTQTVRSTTI